MAAITSLDQVIYLLTSGAAQRPQFAMDSRVNSAAATATISGQISSLWRYNKSNGANGDLPPVSPGEAPTKATLGALPFTNAANGKELWAMGFEGTANTGGTLMMYDRLFHMRGLSGTVTTPQTVGGSITRNTGGEGNQIWLEIYTAIGTTATTISASYTNQAGVSGKITPLVVFGATNSREEARMIKLPLADGDTGVRSVQSVTVTASTGIAGDFGVTLVRPYTRALNEAAACSFFRDFFTGIPSMFTIDNDACIAFAWMASNPVAPRMELMLHLLES